MEQSFKPLLSIIALGLISISCSKNNLETTRDFLPKLDEFTTYHPNLDTPSVPIFDIIEKVEVLGLGNTHGLQSENFWFLEFVNDKIVASNMGLSDIFLFNEKGDFIKPFNQQGSGSQKYSLMLSIWPSGNELIVYDSPNWRLQFYDMSGNYLRTKKINYAPSRMYSINSNYFLDLSRSPIDGQHNFNVLVLDKGFERESMLIGYDKAKPIGLSWPGNSFSPYKKGLTYQYYLNDTVFLIGQNGATPLFSINFGEKWLWKDSIFYASHATASIGIRKKDKIVMYKSFVGEKSIFLNYRINGEIESGIINRLSKKFMKLKAPNGLLKNRSLRPHMWVNNRLVFTISSNDFHEFVQELDPNKLVFKEESNLEKIKSSNSPVIIWMTFKNDF